jgi:3-dehydroquinate dehydratase
MQRERREQQNASKTLKDRRLESTEATELASQLLKPKTVDMEWKAFILAWAEVVIDAQDADSEAIVMSLEDFLSLYDVLQETCRFKWKRNSRKSRANGSRHPVS